MHPTSLSVYSYLIWFFFCARLAVKRIFSSVAIFFCLLFGMCVRHTLFVGFVSLIGIAWVCACRMRTIIHIIVGLIFMARQFVVRLARSRDKVDESEETMFTPHTRAKKNAHTHTSDSWILRQLKLYTNHVIWIGFDASRVPMRQWQHCWLVREGCLDGGWSSVGGGKNVGHITNHHWITYTKKITGNSSVRRAFRIKK